jgi:lysozyme
MVNREALELIKNWEGCKLKAYPDPGSKDGLPWTIGYGHTKGVKKGMKIGPEQAEEFLIEDLKVAEAVIAKYIKVNLNENQYGALVSFIHNLGEEQFVEGSVDNYINENKLDSVPDRLKLYNKNDGKVMKGLVNRRADEIALWSKPSDKIVYKPVQAPPVVPVNNVPRKDERPWWAFLIDLIVRLFTGK